MAKKKRATKPHAPGAIPTPSGSDKEGAAEFAFVWASSFERTAIAMKRETLNLLRQKADGFPVIGRMVTWIVNDSFASELYLKCLHQIHHQKMPWGHDLLPLFDALPIQLKQSMEVSYQHRLKQLKASDRTTLREMLTVQANTFAEMRYGFQLSQWTTNYEESVFNRIARAEILATHPQWLYLATGLDS